MGRLPYSQVNEVEQFRVGSKIQDFIFIVYATAPKPQFNDWDGESPYIPSENTTLKQTMNANDTICTVNDTSLFPASSPQNLIKFAVESEVMQGYVSGSNTFVVTLRSSPSTTHSTGAAVVSVLDITYKITKVKVSGRLEANKGYYYCTLDGVNYDSSIIFPNAGIIVALSVYPDYSAPGVVGTNSPSDWTKLFVGYVPPSTGQQYAYTPFYVFFVGQVEQGTIKVDYKTNTFSVDVYGSLRLLERTQLY